MGPESKMTGVLVRSGGETQRQAQREYCQVTTGAMVRVTPLHAKEHPGLLEPQGARREVWTEFSPGVFRESMARLMSSSWTSNLWICNVGRLLF